MSSGSPKRCNAVRHETGRNRRTDAAARARDQYDLPGDAEQ
jgi:hypothetical protein